MSALSPKNKTNTDHLLVGSSPTTQVTHWNPLGCNKHYWFAIVVVQVLIRGFTCTHPKVKYTMSVWLIFCPGSCRHFSSWMEEHSSPTPESKRGRFTALSAWIMRAFIVEQDKRTHTHSETQTQLPEAVWLVKYVHAAPRTVLVRNNRTELVYVMCQCCTV